MITKRLKVVSGLVDSGAVVADIGTDHGYLLLDLLISSKIENGFGCDINTKPLNNAIQNFKKHKFENNIKFFLGNGLLAIEESHRKDVTCITVCGMGGKLISTILKEIDMFPSVRSIIVCPNNGFEEVRNHFNNSYWKIEYETIINDNDVFYSVIKFVLTNHIQVFSGTTQENHYGVINLDNRSAELLSYMNYRKKHFEKILLNIKANAKNLPYKINEIETEIKFIEDYYECTKDN